MSSGPRISRGSETYNSIGDFMKDKHDEHIHSTPSINSVMGQPETAFEMINKYGTYNIQPTADTRNTFPAISHGLAKKHADENKLRRDEWLQSQREKPDPSIEPKA